MSAPGAIAKWMLRELIRAGSLPQATAADRIASKFGEKFTYTNTNGNLAIRKEVLDAFRKLTGDSVVWELGEHTWRRRQSHDHPGRQQD